MRNDIQKIVSYYVNKFETRNPFEIASNLKIEVQIGPLGSRCGCYMYLKRHRCIFLNENLEEHERRLVMAHELGHAIMHRKENCYFIRHKTLFLSDRIEIEANRFAAELLVPDDLIYRTEYEGFTARQIAYAEGLNEELLRLKFNRKE